MSKHRKTESPVRSSGWEMMRVSGGAEEVGCGGSGVRVAVLWILYPDLYPITREVIRAINYKLIFFFKNKPGKKVLRVNSSSALCVCGFDDSGFPQQKSMKQLSLCPFFLILISSSVKKACTTLFTPGPVNNSCARFLSFFCLYCLNPVEMWKCSFGFWMSHPYKHSNSHLFKASAWGCWNPFCLPP